MKKAKIDYNDDQYLAVDFALDIKNGWKIRANDYKL